MNAKGQASFDSFLAAIIFLIGLYIFVMLYNPLVNTMLSPVLDNAEVMPYGAAVKMFVLLLPIVLAIVGIINIIRTAQKPQYPQM